MGDYDFSVFLNNFRNARAIIVSDELPSNEYAKQAAHLKGSNEIFKSLGVENQEALASALEFVLEGLHLNGKLGKEEISGKIQYRVPRTR